MTPPTDRIPATLLPMDLEGVRAWYGEARACVVGVTPGGAWLHYGLVGAPERVPVADLAPDLTHRSGRYALAVALAAGQACPCGGKGTERCIGCGSLPAERRRGCHSHEDNPCQYGIDTSCCNGSGYLRPPADVFRWLPTGEGGQARPEWSPGLLACSAWRVARGLGPVKGVLAWRCWGSAGVPEGFTRYQLVEADGSVRYLADVGRRRGSRGAPIDERAERAREAVAAGYALADGDGLVLPWPEVTT
jgi:hypothetical protein